MTSIIESSFEINLIGGFVCFGRRRQISFASTKNDKHQKQILYRKNLNNIKVFIFYCIFTTSYLFCIISNYYVRVYYLMMENK